MNNYQNNKYNFLFPPKTVPDYSTTTYPKHEEGKKKRKETKNKNSSKGTLKIFVNSDNSNEWDLKKATTQSYREVNTKAKAPVEVKEKKDVDKTQRKGTPLRGKDKAETKAKPEQETKENERMEKKSEKASESLKSALFNQRFYSFEKTSSDKVKKSEKADTLEAEISAKLSRAGIKMEGKASKINKSSEFTSNPRKFQINEILKNHAQKFQMSPSRSSQKIKDYSFQGVSELLQKIKSSSKSKNEIADECKKEGQGKSDNDETVTKAKEEGQDVGTKASVKATEKKASEHEKIKEIVLNEKTEKEKKKLPDKLMTSPLSNELERRLKSSGQMPEDLFPSSKETKMDKRWEENDDRKWKKVEPATDKVKEDERKRTTYTDRLLMSRAVERVKEAAAESSELKKVNENLIKKVENVGYFYQFQSKINMDEPPKEVVLFEQKNRIPLKEERRNKEATEEIFKAKVTRSTELRDLVTQAVKLDSWRRDQTSFHSGCLQLSRLMKSPDKVRGPKIKQKQCYSQMTNITNTNINFCENLKEHKIFCIFDNHWYIVRPVREELLSRGWLEVIPDRRLIPRRRPPPTGPTYEREKTFVERNCNTIEAILAAKETFVDEIQETVSKCSSFRESLDKSKYFSMGAPVRKISDESVSEVLSQFQILPPTAEKKKNNFEIRDFINKYKTLWEKEKKGNLEEKSGQKVKGSKETVMIVIKRPENGLPALEYNDEGKNNAKAQERYSKTIYSESEAKTISKIIQSTNARIHFMWLSIKPGIHLKCFNYSPEIINKFQKTTFCTKIGLWNHLNNIQWYAHEVNYPAKSPRMYNTGEADDLQAFFQDFQMTACLGLLKWLADTFFNRGLKAVQTKKGKVPLKAFEFAIKQCEKYIRFKDNEELSIVEEQKVLQEEWNTFLQWFYTITNDHGKVQECSSAQLMVVYTKAVETLKLMRRYWPEIDIDGRLNIWIMKPYCASCGRGIFMTNNVYYIGQHSKYIVQKYIEKPLLIYNTKFDIRQWFMITKLTPLEIWMYKECYLRFCTQPFALRNLHESVHLSNNSVQRKYISYRDPGLPDQNMWDSNTFQLYLKTIGHPTAWQDIIYPGMKDAIVSVMLAAQDTFDGPRRSWFEVYGADFMLSANVKDGPWLIEINENPAMDPSTKVTARLCPQMLRDVIKVVVDKRANKNASTGQWELIYRQNYSPSFGSVDLDVKGKKIARVPHVTKIGLNIQHQTSSSSNSNVRNYYDDARFYDLVKSYDKQNSKGVVNDYVSSLVEKYLGKEQVKPSEDVSQIKSDLSKDRMVLNRQTLMLVDQAQKARQEADKRKESDLERPQTFGSVLASTELRSFSDVKDAKTSKNDKNPVTVISSMHRKRLKRMRKCAESTNLERDSNETDKSSALNKYRMAATGNRDTPPGLNQFIYETEKLKYAK